jgi:hypothetical protein
VIHTSTKYQDLAFVARTLREHKLSPKPLSGYNQQPDYWNETDRWRRIVERYEWGAVVFLSNRGKDEHATLVIVGELDVATGAVRGVGAAQKVAIAWYKELATTFSAAAAGEVNVPPCLGYREADHVCDGGLNADRQMERPCAWRDRCIALQEEAARNEKLPDELIAGLEATAIVQLTTRLLTVVDSKRVQKPVRATPEAHAVFEGLWKALGESLAPRRFVSRREEAEVGDIFAIDRVESSGYIRIYCAVESGRPLLIAGVRLKAHDGVDLQLPLDPKSSLLKDVEAHVVSWRDGGFQSALKRVPTRVSLDKACDIICAMIANGAVRLPAPKDVAS